MQKTLYRLCFTLLALTLFQTSGLAQEQSRGISLLLLPRMKPDSVDTFLREAKNGRTPAQIFIAVGVNFACRVKGGDVVCDVPPYENVRRVADELLTAGKRVTMIFYSFQDNESLNSHPGGVGEGSQGLSEAKPLETDSRLSRVLKGCEIVNDKGTNEDLSHPFRMQSTLGTVPGVSLPLNPWLPSSRPSRARIKKTFSLKLYFSFHANSATDQAKRRDNLIRRLGPEFLNPLGDWSSGVLSLQLSPSLEDEMEGDAEWKAAAEGMANQLVAGINPDARLAGRIRFLRNPINKKSVGVPGNIVVNGCGGQCRFDVYREHHGLVENNGLGQKSWRFFSNDGAPVYQNSNEDKKSIPDATGDQGRAREMDDFVRSLKDDRRIIILWRPEGNLFKKNEAGGRVSFRRPREGDYQVPNDCIVSSDPNKSQIIPECRIDTETSGLDAHFIRRLQRFWR